MSTYAKLGKVLDKDNYEWLLANYEQIASAVEAEMIDGGEPEAIGRFMTRHIGEDRRAIVARVISAARYLQSTKG